MNHCGVLVYPICCNKRLQSGWRKQQNSLLTGLEAGNSKFKVLVSNMVFILRPLGWEVATILLGIHISSSLYVCREWGERNKGRGRWRGGGTQTEKRT